MWSWSWDCNIDFQRRNDTFFETPIVLFLLQKRDNLLSMSTSSSSFQTRSQVYLENLTWQIINAFKVHCCIFIIGIQVIILMHYWGMLLFQGRDTQSPISLSEMTSQAVCPDPKSPFMIMVSQRSLRSKDDHVHRQNSLRWRGFPT